MTTFMNTPDIISPQKLPDGQRIARPPSYKMKHRDKVSGFAQQRNTNTGAFYQIKFLSSQIRFRE